MEIVEEVYLVLGAIAACFGHAKIMVIEFYLYAAQSLQN